MQLQSAKCLVGNSIIDGLKSRLMQYLKHVVEDDVLFTKVISKFKPVTVIFLDFSCIHQEFDIQCKTSLASSYIILMTHN